MIGKSKFEDTSDLVNPSYSTASYEANSVFDVDAPTGPTPQLAFGDEVNFVSPGAVLGMDEDGEDPFDPNTPFTPSAGPDFEVQFDSPDMFDDGFGASDA